MFDFLVEKIAERITKLTEEAYSLGFEAGYNARAVKDNEDQNTRLHEMYRYGIERGREEARTEIGEIDGSWFKTLTDMAAEEAAARQEAEQQERRPA